jgi:hypothetical protein
MLLNDEVEMLVDGDPGRVGELLGLGYHGLQHSRFTEQSGACVAAIAGQVGED